LLLIVADLYIPVCRNERATNYQYYFRGALTIDEIEKDPQEAYLEISGNLAKFALVCFVSEKKKHQLVRNTIFSTEACH
jgi:hypothetical protein